MFGVAYLNLFMLYVCMYVCLFLLFLYFFPVLFVPSTTAIYNLMSACMTSTATTLMYLATNASLAKHAPE